MKSVITSKSNNLCKHCNHELVWKAHPKVTERELKRPFYFSKWESCLNCKAIWLHEEFKVWNRNGAAEIQRNYEECSQQMSFLCNI
jgi:hypothetical protein